MWERIDVWRMHDSTTIACYRVYRDLSTQLYSVQSLDFVRSEADLKASESQSIELFLEENPGIRSCGLVNLEDAIRSFDAEFSA